jgi:hypothetical protein
MSKHYYKTRVFLFYSNVISMYLGSSKPRTRAAEDFKRFVNGTTQSRKSSVSHLAQSVVEMHQTADSPIEQFVLYVARSSSQTDRLVCIKNSIAQ